MASSRAHVFNSSQLQVVEAAYEAALAEAIAKNPDPTVAKTRQPGCGFASGFSPVPHDDISDVDWLRERVLSGLLMDWVNDA